MRERGQLNKRYWINITAMISWFQKDLLNENWMSVYKCSQIHFYFYYFNHGSLWFYFIFFCFYMCNVMTYTSSWRDILLYALHCKNPLTAHLISNFRKCWSIKDLRKLFALNVCWPCFEHKHWVHFAEQFWQVNWLMVYYVLFLYPLLLWNVSEFQVIVLHIMRWHSTIPSFPVRLRLENKKKYQPISVCYILLKQNVNFLLIMLFQISWN